MSFERLRYYLSHKLTWKNKGDKCPNGLKKLLESLFQI